MADNYREYFNKQLKSKEDTFDFAQTMFQQVNNDYWKEKSNLWHIISAACNDAAGEFYVKLKEYVKNLADIDVCTIHSLKSIAQSVDAAHLLDFTESLQTIPVELRQLLDILSIKPSKLFEANQKLNMSVLLPLLGNIDRRSCLYRPQKLSLALLKNIIDNIDKIEKWFEYNVILPDATIKYIYEESKADGFNDIFKTEAKLYNEGLDDDSAIWYYGYNEKIDVDKEGYYEAIYTNLNDLFYLKVQDIINNIRQFGEIVKYIQQGRDKDTQLTQPLGFQFKYNTKVKDRDQFLAQFCTTPSIVVQGDGKFLLNPFFALIEIVKARLYASKTGLPMLSYYVEKGDNNITVSMSDLMENMATIIKSSDNCYIKNYMLFHIYNLFYNRIINDTLKDDFEIKCTTDKQGNVLDIQKKTYVSKYSPMTYEEFYPQVSAFISNNELKEFLGQSIEQDVKQITDFKEIEIANKVQISHFKKEYINFIQYLSLVNSIAGVKDQNNQRLPYLIYRYNNDIHDGLNLNISFNQYYRRLLGISGYVQIDDEKGEIKYNSQNLVAKVAKYLTDICIRISYIRQQIKAIVQQYSFIGTQRIVTDVVRDYFVKNFSKRSSWRYISDVFKNKDDSEYLKTKEQLNGADQNSQFNAQIIEYFDQTDYLNIQTDLPYTIGGYNNIVKTVPTTFISSEDTLSTWILTSDLVSSVNDDLGILVPSSLYPSPGAASSFTIPAVTIEATGNYAKFISGLAEGPLTSNQVMSTFTTTSTYIEYPTLSSNSYTFETPLSTEKPEGKPSAIFSSYYIDTLSMTQTDYDKIVKCITGYELRENWVEQVEYSNTEQEQREEAEQIPQEDNIKPLPTDITYTFTTLPPERLTQQHEEWHYSSEDNTWKRTYEHGRQHITVKQTYFFDEYNNIWVKMNYPLDSEQWTYNPITMLWESKEEYDWVAHYDTNDNFTCYKRNTGWIVKERDEDNNPITWYRRIKRLYYNVQAGVKSNYYKAAANTILSTIHSMIESATITLPKVDQTNLIFDIQTPSTTTIQISPQQVITSFIDYTTQKPVTGLFYNEAASSFTIPAGTKVSAVIPAGNEIVSSVPSTIQTAVWVKGNDLVEKANVRFWERNLDLLGYEDLSGEILFYQKYFSQLANAPTNKAKVQIYKTEVYPILSSVWDTFATSGLNSNGNEKIHQLYSGQYPGTQLEKNIGNQSYTTIAPLPYIPNLIQLNEYDNDDSYIVKPLYDNISYYMNMFMAQMFNMYEIQAENGLAIAIDGWKQTHIELKGYCSRYERAANTLTTQGEMNSKLDWDGPWVYSSLKAFLTLKEDGKISKKDIRQYVNDYFFNLTTSKVKENMVDKLYRYQQDIFTKGNGNWKLYSFQTDVNDNQYTLFKRKDYFKYEDVGQIWVRMKNFPLSIPLMSRNVVLSFKDVKYQNDPFDTLLCNEDTRYANMFKQMINNAVQFGVIKDVMWVLGYTNFTTNVNGRLVFNQTDKVLKLVSFKFIPREDFTLIIDLQTVKFYHIDQTYDRINNFNQFVGVNYKQKTNSIDFVLYDKEKDENGNQIDNFKIYNYDIDNNDVDDAIPLLKYEDLEKPALQIQQIEALIETYIDSQHPYIEEGYTYNFLDNNLSQCFGIVYSNSDGEYYISGYSGETVQLSQIFKNTIYDSTLSTFYDFNYKINTENGLPEKQNVQLIDKNNIQFTSVFAPLIHFNVQPNKYLDNINLKTTINSYASIWRLNADQNNTAIAYQAYDLKDKPNDIITATCFNWDAKDAENQKVLNNILTFNCELLTKQVIDSNNNVIYLNQIKSISTALTETDIYINEKNFDDYIALQLEFPYCNLSTNNQLCIASLVTTLGSYKSLTVDKNEKSIWQLNGNIILQNAISASVANSTSPSSFEDLVTTLPTNAFKRFRDNQGNYTRDYIKFDEDIEPYQQLFNGQLTGTYEFYSYYEKYIEAKQQQQPRSQQKVYLELYNKQMAKLNDVVAFAPVVNEFLVQPLKIIFNFGNEFAFDINQVNPNNTNYFDMDINVFLDTEEEKYKKVGWRCGLWQTDYINWVTRDQRFGSPEIASVDIDKYKNDYITLANMSDSKQHLDIIVNTCWFNQSQIQSLNPNIIINWKGFTYRYLIEDIDTNQGCCDFPFIKIRVGLNNNTLKCYRKVLIPACLYNKHTEERLFGFVRIWQDELDDEEFLIIKNSYETDDFIFTIDQTNIYRTYQQFEQLYNDQTSTKQMLRKMGIYVSSKAKDLKDALDYNKTTILNIEDKIINEQTGEQDTVTIPFQFHVKKIIIL